MVKVLNNSSLNMFWDKQLYYLIYLFIFLFYCVYKLLMCFWIRFLLDTADQCGDKLCGTFNLCASCYPAETMPINPCTIQSLQYTQVGMAHLLLSASARALWTLFLHSECVFTCVSSAQPWHTHSPMMQPPFYDMTASLPSNTSGSCSLNYTPDLEAGPCSYEWTHQQPSEPDLYHRGQRKRQRQASDSGSSSEDQRGNEGGQKCRKCKRKKKY